MKKVSVIGHFGFGRHLLNGQTIKTCNVARALEGKFSELDVEKYDTFGGVCALLKMPFIATRALRNSENVVFLLASRGVKYALPILLFFNRKRKRKTHFIVIGGWLPSLCKKNKALLKRLGKISFIYVETLSMKRNLEELGLRNVVFLPNFKFLVPLNKDQLVQADGFPVRLCTFSRVMKEKGIEDAIKAVVLLNKTQGFIKYSLDIFGQIEKSEIAWFNELKKEFPPFVEYKGEVDSYKSVDVVKNYHALLFPTYYSGEGFAGTLLDAMAAGVPAIASNWKYNPEIINGRNGVLFESRNVEELAMAIDTLNVSKEDCLAEYKKYSPDCVIDILVERM